MNANIKILLLISLLPGCIGKNIPPADIYTLSPDWNKPSLQVAEEKLPTLIIKLAPVHATRALTSTEILYTDSPFSWNSYVNSRWNDTPVKLLQTLFQINIEKTKLFKAVLPPISVSTADLLLETTLLDLSHHINNDGTSSGNIRVRFYLIDNKTRTVTASKEFSSKVLASTKNAKGVVEALNKAANSVALELVSWLAEHQ